MQDLFRSSLGCRIGCALLVAAWGCSDEQTGLFIQGNLARLPPSCEARAEPTSLLLGIGTLDVSLKLDYDASLLVGSQLAPRSDKENLRSETMIAVVEGAEVHLYSDTGSPVLAFTVPASGVILPDASDEAGYGIINATLIPQAQGDDLARELQLGQVITRVAEVSVFGKTVGGLEVESAAIRYVIRVCNGCLVDFPPAAVSAAGQCTLGGDQMIGDLPCRPGQDAVVDCRSCARSNPAACLGPG